MIYPIEITPAFIAGRCLPEDATPGDRVLVEAMVERAIKLAADTQPGRTSFGTLLGIEQALVNACRKLIAQHNIRYERVMRMIESSVHEDDAA